MKIGIPTTGKSLEDAMDPRFGRALRFLIVESESGEFTLHDNEINMKAAQGAGIQTSQTLVELGVEVVIAGHIGPKAEKVLKAAGIGIFLHEEGTAAEALAAFRASRCG